MIQRIVALWQRWRGLMLSWRRGVRCRSIPVITGPRVRVLVEPGGRLDIGHRCRIDRDVEIVVQPGATLTLGDDVYIGHGSVLVCAESLKIGDDTMLADMVCVRDVNHRRLPGLPLRESGIETRPIVIGRDCWLGSKVTVVAGARIGDRTTVGANAVVTGELPGNCVAAGVPARILRMNDRDA